MNTEPRLILRLIRANGNTAAEIWVPHSYFTGSPIHRRIERMLVELIKLLPQGFCLSTQKEADKLREGLDQFRCSEITITKELVISEVRQSSPPLSQPQDGAQLFTLQADLQRAKDQLARSQAQRKNEVSKLSDQLQAAVTEKETLTASALQQSKENIELHNKIQSLEQANMALSNQLKISQTYQERYTKCQERLRKCEEEQATAKNTGQKPAGQGGEKDSHHPVKDF